MGQHVKDETDNRYGKLTVIERAPTRVSPSGQARTYWRCRCDCGNIIETWGANLRSGYTTSCRCWSGNHVHRLAHHPLYKVWHCMISRCYREYDPGFVHYGGRGITICDQWRDPETGLQQFISDMYPTYKKGLSIDRINNNGSYEPSNCRWATVTEQNNNTRRNTRVKIHPSLQRNHVT